MLDADRRGLRRGVPANEARLFEVDRLLELELFLSDAMSFVPMQFGFADRTIGKPDRRHSLHLAPLPAAVHPVQSTTIAQAVSRGDRLRFPNIAENLKPHTGSLPRVG